jgi:Mg2+ and Co2+ transporter CorA
MTTDNQRIENNVEQKYSGATETVEEQPKLYSEVINVDSVRSFEDQCSNHQIGARRRSKLKKRTQRNVESSKKLIAVHTRVTRRAAPTVRKGNMRKRLDSENIARRMPQSKMHWSSTWEETTE